MKREDKIAFIQVKLMEGWKDIDIRNAIYDPKRTNFHWILWRYSIETERVPLIQDSAMYFVYCFFVHIGIINMQPVCPGFLQQPDRKFRIERCKPSARSWEVRQLGSGGTRGNAVANKMLIYTKSSRVVISLGACRCLISRNSSGDRHSTWRARASFKFDKESSIESPWEATSNSGHHEE